VGTAALAFPVEQSSAAALMSENSQSLLPYWFILLARLRAMPECPLYAEPELYDLLFPHARDSASISDEVRRERIVASEQFYLEEAKQAGGRVLELACGSGRLTVPIAQSGVDIV